MDAWWFRIAYLALFIFFFFIFRFLFNRWRRQALEEQLAFHNLQMANQGDITARMGVEEANRARQMQMIIDEPPPEFETAVKYSIPVSYIELEIPPPSYEDILKQTTSDNPGASNNPNHIDSSSILSQPENIINPPESTVHHM